MDYTYGIFDTPTYLAMKTLLLALFISLSGFVTAQCDATFSYSFDNTTDKLTCWPNDTTGEHEWNVDNGYYSHFIHFGFMQCFEVPT